MPLPNINLIRDYLLDLQQVLTGIIQNDSHITLQEDHWSREQGGGGRTHALSNGVIYEKAGINFSHIWDEKLPETATLQRPELTDCQFQAIGLSLIIHPLNPFVPTCHANLRFFLAQTPWGEMFWWFGGGFDLTPYYGFDEDCIHWHLTAKKACDPFGKDVYPRYKAWADNYFYLKHRQESRGIGGLFFDDLNQWGFERCFSFMQNVGEHFKEAYFPIVDRRKDVPYAERHRNFQLCRRGRYVEFNLVYDRGTLFGLQSDGRIESILLSLPPIVSWPYNSSTPKGSREAELYERYLKPRDWLNLDNKKS